MAHPSVKEGILEAVRQLPDDATVEDVIERLRFLSRVQRGLEQSEAGTLIDHAEVKRRFLP